MKTTILKIMLLSILPFLVVGSVYSQKNSISGNSKIVEHTVPIEEFTNIELEIDADLYYELRPDIASGFRMEIDENLIPYLEISLKKEKISRKEKLVIKSTESIKPSKCIIYTNSRSIKDIDMNGTGNVHIEKNLNTKDLNVKIKGIGSFNANDIIAKSVSIEVSGAGGASLKGSTQSLELKVGKKGTGSIQAIELTAETVKCEIDGSGNMEVNTTKGLDIKIGGSGNVIYKGSPRYYSHKLDGAGNVQQAQVE